jgi:hypothetical protein
LRHVPGHQLAGRAAAEDENFISLYLGHGFLRVVDDVGVGMNGPVGGLG